MATRMIELQRALCLVRGGDMTARTQHAHYTMAALPTTDSILPVLDLGNKVHRSAPGTHQNRPDVTDFHDLLTSSTPNPW